MPKINKIRVINISYADGSKRIPDITFDAKLGHLLLLLQNGGGKTTLLQLIIQCVLPNSPLGKRRISDYLDGTRTTSHAAVEWQLDGDGQKQFLITAFSFTQGEGDQKLSYLMWTDLHAGETGRRLNDLPLCKDTRSMSLKELKDWMKAEARPNFQFYDTIESYKRELATYNLHKEHWENVHTIIGAEGGVERYFSSAKKTRDLIERVFVPSIEIALYSSEQSKQLIVNSFNQYLDSLIELPKHQKDIADFSSIERLAAPLLTSVKRLEETLERQIESKTRLFLGHQKMSSMLDDIKVKIAEVELSQSTAKIDQKEASWKNDSHEAFLKTAEVQELGEQTEALRVASEEYGSLIKKLTYQREFLLALAAADKWNALDSHAQALSAKIEHIGSSDPELKAKMESDKGVFSYFWHSKKEELEQVIGVHESEQLTAKVETKTLKTSQKEVQKKLQDITVEKTKTQDQINQILQIKEAIEKTFGFQAATAPNAYLAIASQDIKSLETRLETAQRDLVSIKATRGEFHKRRIELADKIPTTRSLLHSAQMQIISAQESAEELMKLLLDIGIPVADQGPIDQKQFLAQELLKIQNQVSSDIADCIGNEITLKSQKELVEISTVWVAHPLLLKVQKHLKSCGVNAMLGVVWLSEAGMKDEEKLSLIETFPFLPYGFIAETRDIQKSEEKIGLLGEAWSEEFPLVFYDKKDISRGYKPEDVYETSPKVFTPPGIAKVWDKDRWQEWILSLNVRLSDSQIRHTHLENRRKEIERVESKLNEFCQRWDNDQLPLLHEKERKLVDEMLLLTADMEQLNSGIARLYQEELKAEQQKSDSTEQLSKLTATIRQIQAYQIHYTLLPLLLATKIELDEESREAETQDTTMDRRMDSLNEKILEIERIVSALGEKKRDIEKDEILFEDSAPTPPDDTEASYESIRSRIFALRDVLSKRHQDIENIRGELERTSAHKKDENASILRFLAQPSCPHDLTREDLRRSARRIESIEIDEMGQKISDGNSKYQDALKSCQQTKIEHARAESALGKIIEQIEKNYPQQSGAYSGYTNECQHSEKQYWASEVDRLAAQYLALQIQWDEFNRKASALYLAKQDIEQGNEGGMDSPDTAHALDEEDVRLLSTEPQKWAHQIRRILNSAMVEEVKFKNETLNKHRVFVKTLSDAKNPRLAEFIRVVDSLESNGKLYDHGWMQSAVGGISQKIELFKSQTEHRISELSKEKTEIILQLVTRAEEFRRRILELATLTTIDLHGESIKLVKIKLEVPDAQTSRDRMERHIERLVEQINDLDRRGVTTDEKHSYVTDLIGNKAILNVISPLEQASVSLLKPAQESAFRQAKSIYTDWSNLALWSIGEKFSAHMTVFLMLTGYIKSTASSKNSWQAVIVDNPFGAASSPHILDPVFSLADALKIQLISCTGHLNESILRRFPARYSLKLVPHGGRNYLTVHRMETLYGLTAMENEEDQLSLLQESMPRSTDTPIFSTIMS